ncbi:unnamed protein product [Heligmosomoides polygyrus]|uniref:Transposase n=1 Tax=Heligmosomoides polygyrus TaxID=6339 RepID=A0A183GMD5_HELPZ|nr:unnamed protein product [Heligmosomoides polygyrus]
MQHAKHSTDSEAFLGMSGLMDQVAHDSIMDDGHLERILFPSNGGKRDSIRAIGYSAKQVREVDQARKIDPSTQISGQLVPI